MRSISFIVRVSSSDDKPINDHPSEPGDGDHEHYFFYLKSKRERLKVYDSNGEAYTGCYKRAIIVRERNTQLYWWELVSSNTLERLAKFESIFVFEN